MSGDVHYRLTLRPKSGRGSFCLSIEVVVAFDMIRGGMLIHEFLQERAWDAARKVLGRESAALRVTRVEQQYAEGWREVRFPVPHKNYNYYAMTFSKDGELQVPHDAFPTWPI